MHPRHFERAYDALPLVLTVDGLPVRWLGPLVERGSAWPGDLSAAAYGYLEDCGWQELVPSGPAWEGDALTPPWAAGLAAAARCLAEAGGQAGPEGDPGRWASWLAWELAALHPRVRALAEAG